VVRYNDLIRNFGVLNVLNTKRKIEWWRSLVHVCRRWRCLVFGSPRHLNLEICYTPRPCERKSLYVWPTPFLVILGSILETSVVNIIAKLKLSDRVSQIHLKCYTTLQAENLWTAMQMPFPELVVLNLRGSEVPALPDSFLGRSAPRLRYLHLNAVPFPGLPKLLLSTTHLAYLWLVNIPHSGYISSEAMATSLSLLTSLNTLQREFESPQSSPDQESRRSPPPTRIVLPFLMCFRSKG
jgi:hypothetical protein